MKNILFYKVLVLNLNEKYKCQILEMILEISAVLITSTCLAIFYIAKKNKREKIDFHGKHVIITGGSSGIGFDLSVEAFKQGAHVSVIARNKVIKHFLNIF